MTTLAKVDITGAWTLVYDASLSGAFTGLVSCLSSDQVIYRIDTVAPAANASGILAGNPMPVSLASPQRLYARAPDGAATVVMDFNLGLNGLPAGVFEGYRAMTVQDYDEANKKHGTQWESSTRVQLTGTTGVLLTVFRTGNKPVDLKQRVLGFDGLGLIGRIYRNPTYTGGTIVPWFNMRTSLASVQPEVQVLTGATVTVRGTEIAAPIYAFGPASQQSRGSTPTPYASNRIFDEPNTEYLLAIETLDTQAQYISSRLEIFEGALDLPL